MNLKLSINYFFINIKNVCILKKRYKNFILFKKKILISNKKLNFYFIKFIINVTSKKSNIFIHILNCLGFEIFFCSAKFLLKKNYNLKTKNYFEYFYKIIIQKLNFLKNQPIAVYLNNIGYNYKWFLNKLAKRLFLINIKIFNKYSYNGCKLKKKKRWSNG